MVMTLRSLDSADVEKAGQAMTLRGLDGVDVGELLKVLGSVDVEETEQ